VPAFVSPVEKITTSYNCDKSGMGVPFIFTADFLSDNLYFTLKILACKQQFIIKFYEREKEVDKKSNGNGSVCWLKTGQPYAKHTQTACTGVECTGHGYFAWQIKGAWS
jgi:hypothetical protein